jgi:hypothetical protein
MANPTFPQMQHFFRPVEDGYPVTLDYSLTFADRISAGRYDWKNDDIKVENFPVKGEGETDIKLRLITLGRTATTKEIEEHLDALGLQPAKIEHLLAFGGKYPDKQREFPIIALGSVWVSSGGYRGVPDLDGRGSERRLVIRWLDPSNRWCDVYRFLAFSK